MQVFKANLPPGPPVTQLSQGFAENYLPDGQEWRRVSDARCAGRAQWGHKDILRETARGSAEETSRAPPSGILKDCRPCPSKVSSRG